MNLVLVTDIYGRNPQLEAWAAGLRWPGRYLRIVDPYGGTLRFFGGQQEAYEEFQVKMGLDRYTELLAEVLGGLEGPKTLLGFSVGASAAWRLAGQAAQFRVSRVVGFYGSRIRDYVDSAPQCETILIQAGRERGFAVEELNRSLERLPGVRLLRTPYGHGFMNPLTPYFDSVACDNYTNWLVNDVIALAGKGLCSGSTMS